MVQINFAQKSVTVKIVYYGPGMSGKTTNLEVVHQRAPESNKGDLTSISTDGDRTLFFDFMPLDLGTVAGMRTQFQLYTVPGQVYYNSTRKLVLQGVDGVIFIADSSASMMEENLESLRNLEENLREYGKDITTIPMVIQYNKRDLPDALPVEELEAKINRFGAPSFEGIASSGQGVFPTLKSLAANVLDTIHEQSGAAGAERSAPAPAAPATAPPSAPLPAPAAQQPVQQPAPAMAPAAQQSAAPVMPAPSMPTRAAAEPPMAAAPAPVAPSPELRMAQPTAPPSMPSSPPASAVPMAPMPPPTAVHTPAPTAPRGATARAYAPTPAGQPGPGARVPGPRAGSAAPAGRLRPRSGSARAISASPQQAARKSTLVTAAVVVVAVAAGIAIGGAVFNLI
jgi:signal recognition particle receptor subunit beta